ncbi:MAG: excinuclease ABC subunit A [Acidobacteria bacterium]|nr:excinuclease ABC subunit A [Acidobacteriota bacterium]
MIRSFRCRDTEDLSRGISVRRFRAFENQARTRLARLQAAASLDDLARIPGNRLEALAADRRGQYSIRVNDQWRICFVWGEKGPEAVEIVDYH